MQVGDLVKFKENGHLGVVIGLGRYKTVGTHDSTPWYRVLWTDGSTGKRWNGELEVVSASR